MVHLQRRKFLVAATGLALGGLFGTARVLASDSALPRPEAIFETVQVADGVYALVGELDQRSPANLGNNMTCGLSSPTTRSWSWTAEAHGRGHK